MNKLGIALIFISGTIAGSAGGYLFAQKKYKKIADEEIKSVIDTFSRHEPDPETVNNDNKILDKPDLESIRKSMEAKQAIDISKDEGYEPISEEDVIVNEDSYSEEDNDNGDIENDEIEDGSVELVEYGDEENALIDSFTFGSNDFETITLVYYMGDHIMTYDDGTIMQAESIEKFVGSAFLKEFDKGNDAFYVRNHHLNIDYEVLKDNGKYSEAMTKRL